MIENDWIRRGLLIVTFPLFVIGGMALLLSIAMFEMVDAVKRVIFTLDLQISVCCCVTPIK